MYTKSSYTLAHSRCVRCVVDLYCEVLWAEGNCQYSNSNKRLDCENGKTIYLKITGRENKVSSYKKQNRCWAKHRLRRVESIDPAFTTRVPRKPT